ncbi:aconitase/3-isopropylmalate dehydratase large subunit family protein [Planktothrix sp. FACHB-1365]|uniref:aconitase/3-isopropylmalate dehydratase large subunit family protein n=1 Tax=Planktothrix sp. FACHB-1365 TaxID=2692855 RepID=UPI001685C253|nr:aconitase/3-isopropylmalate dehydratase large subunit family protein [Planktothrix sp. FACHB-1365]MBD2483962.1 3-isopropylmalate dehydratase large subunit [Planktothrix sp. FACHB-1365]
MKTEPKVLTLGDDINTDDIIPAKRCTTAEPEYLKQYAFEHLIGEGNLLGYDEIVAGRNFGCGSSRENAPIAIKAAGIKKVRAHSFAEIFYRNSINIGLTLEIDSQTQSNPVVEAIVSAGGLIPFNQKRQKGEISIPKSATSARAMTMAEKLLARASGNNYVQPGETVFVKVDLAMSHDAVAAPVAKVFYEHFGEDAKLWDANRVVLVADHFIQVNDLRVDPKATLQYSEMVEFARAQSCHLLDVVSPGEAAGICHVLLPEKGFIRPGTIVAGTDSHTCTYGAFGCFSTGVGTTDMANIFAMGDMWVQVPPTLLFQLEGTLPKYITAKDIMLFILGKIGCDGAAGKVMEFRGSIIDRMPMEERMTLSNMAIECGAMCGLIAPDNTTHQYLQRCGQDLFEEVISDPDANYEDIYQFDLSHLEPQVACPPKPDRVVGISELGEVPITKAFIGSCTGGKLFDLALAAEVLKGRHVAPGVSLFIVPASIEVRKKAENLGYMQIFVAAGATVLKSGCGACINAGFGVLDKEETGVYATNRNFKGRSGDPTAKNYLASPRVVAISAVEGRISDQLSPRAEHQKNTKN